MTTVVILQSNYLPWRGYFDLLRRADHFVIYDTVQYTTNDWRNRNRIVGPKGAQWLTLPIRTKGRFGQSINEAEISDPDWARRHVSAIDNALAQAPYYKPWLRERLHDWFHNISGETRLSKVNKALIGAIAGELGLRTRLHDAADLPQLGDRTGRLVSICAHLGATHYLSGPSAQNYLDEEQFAAHNIAVDWMRYTDYSHYKQVDGGYRSDVSTIDALAHLPIDMIFTPPAPSTATIQKVKP